MVCVRAPALLVVLPLIALGAAAPACTTCDVASSEGGFKERAKPAGTAPPPSAVGVDITEAMMLVGTIVLVMALFYLVNCDDDIAAQTWSLLSSVISIFCAVLTYTVITALMACAGASMTSWFGLVFLIILLVILQLELFSFRKGRVIALLSIGTLTGHVMGFAYIDFLGFVQEQTFFSNNWVLGLLYALVVLLVLFLISLATGAIRGNVAAKAKPPLPGEWEDQCDDTENDVISMTTGLFISRFIRFAIDGKLPPVEGFAKDKTTAECWVLAATTLVVALLILGAAAAAAKKAGRATDIAMGVFSMTMAWNLLFLGQWGYWNYTSGLGLYGQGKPMTAKLVMALFDSTVVIVLLILIFFAAQHSPIAGHALKPFTTALGLALGFSWEKTFDLAIDNIGDKFGDGASETGKHLIKVVIAICLIAIVMPAWTHFILLRTAEGAEDLKKQRDELEDGESDSGEE